MERVKLEQSQKNQYDLEWQKKSVWEIAHAKKQRQKTRYSWRGRATGRMHETQFKGLLRASQRWTDLAPA